MNDEYYVKFAEELRKLGATDDQIQQALEIKIREDQAQQLKAQQPQQQPGQEPQDSSLMAPWQHLAEQAQLPADPNAPKPVDAFTSSWKRGQNLAELSNILFGNEAPTEEQLGQVAKLQQEQQAAATSPSYAKFNQARTLKESLQALVDNPVQIIGEVFIESIAGQYGNISTILGRAAEGGAIGAAAGTAAFPGIGTGAGLAGGISSGVVEGMAETSLKLEWAGKFLEALQEAGVDTSSPESLKEAFSNEEILDKARTAAYKKAIPIAIFDLISGGIAGKIVSKPAKSLLGKIGSGAAELAVQSALGGGGEALGEITSGEQLSPSDILAEVLGEGATSPVEIAAGAHAYHLSRHEDPVIANAAADIQDTGDIDLEQTMDQQYEDIARRMDELSFEPVSDEEIRRNMGEAGIQDMYFPEANEENDLQDTEYTPEEAAKIQAQAPLPSQAEQEARMAEDDSEATPAISAIQDFEKQESDRLEFESKYTPEELAQMSEEDAAPASVRKAKAKFEQQQSTNDTQNKEGVSGEVGRGQEPEQTKPDQGTSVKAPKAGRVLQTQKEVKPKKPKAFSWDALEEQPTEVLKERLEDETGVPDAERIDARVRALETELKRREEAKTKRVRTKPEIDPEERKRDLIVKYQGQLKNIMAEKKPGKKLKRLQILNEHTLALPEVNAQVKAEIQKVHDRANAKAVEAELKNLPTKEKIARIAERVSPEDKETATAFETLANLSEVPQNPTEEQWNEFEKAYHAVSGKGTFSTEFAELQNIYNRVKKEYDKALTPAREEAKALAAAQKEETHTKQKDKDYHLTTIAKAVAQDNPVSIRQALDEYKAWRREQKLSETTDDKALKAANAEFYQERADKEIKREAEVQAEKERKERAKERKEREAKAKAEKKAKENDATKGIKKQFGLSDDADVNLIDPKEQLPADVQPFVTGVEKVTLNDLFQRVQKIYTNVKFLQGFDQLLNLAKAVTDKFYKNGLEIYLVDEFTIARGANFNDLGTNRQIIIIPRTEFAVTDAHELVHYLARAIVATFALSKGVREGAGRNFNRYSHKDFLLYLASGRKFYDKLDQIHNSVLRQYRDILTGIGRKFSMNAPLDAKEINFLSVLSSYLERRGKEDYVEITTARQTQALIDDTFDALGRKITYGLYDSDEMLAETFSNPYFMTLMSLFEAPELPSAGKTQSAFRSVIDGLKELINGFYKLINKAVPKTSYLDHLVEYMTSMEKVLEGGEILQDKETITGDANVDVLLRENSALYMAMGGTNLPINKITPELRKLINYIANSWYKREDIVSLEGVERELETINAKTTKNKFGQAEANLIWKKIQKYRQWVADAKTIQRNSFLYAKKSIPEYNTQRAFKRDIDDFTSVNLDELPISKVVMLTKNTVALVQGGIPSNAAYNFVNKIKAVEKLQSLLDHAGKYGKNPGIYIPTKVSVAGLANPATYSSILAKYNTKAANTLFKHLYGGLMKARTWTSLESKAFTDSMFNTVNHYDLGHSDFVRAGMYGTIFSTRLAPTDADYWIEVEYNAAKVVENAKNKITAFEREVFRGRADEPQIRQELEIAKDLYNLIHNRTSKDELRVPMSHLLSAGQQELYNKMRAFSSTFEADMERNTKGVWDGNFDKQHNYFPTYALGNARTGNVKSADEFIPSDRVNNLWEALHNNKNYGQILARQSGFSKDKVQPSHYFYDYDIMSIAHKFAPSILFDLYAARELKILNQLLNGNNNNPIKFGCQDIDNVFSGKAVEGLNKQIKSIVGGITMYEEGLTKAYKWMQAAKNNTASAMLGTTGQFLVQVSSAVPAAILMAPRGFVRALAVLTGIERGENHSALKEAMDRLKDKGVSITIRDVLFERWQTIEDVQRAGLGRAYRRWGGTADQITTWMLRNGDKFAARLVWFSEFFANGGDIANPSEEAILAAERQVGILQNMSDVAFSAPMLRTNSQAARILASMLYAFQAFALNNALNFIYGTKYSFTTNNREARQVMVASILMAASYNAVQSYLVRPAYNAVANRLFGTDDDDEDKNFTQEDEVFWGTIWDLLVAQWAPSFVEGIIKYHVIKPAMERRAEEAGEEFDQYKDIPIYMPSSEADVYAESAGLYGEVAAGGISLGKGLYHAMDQMYNGEEFEMDQINRDALRASLMFSKIIPLRGDLQKLFRNYDRKMAAEERARKKLKNNGEGVETGTEFEAPAFELPEYELNMPENPTDIPE